MKNKNSKLNDLEVQASATGTEPPVKKVCYSVSQTAQAADTCPAMIYRAINSGKLKALKFGKRTLITPEAIKEWLAGMDPYPVNRDGV